MCERLALQRRIRNTVVCKILKTDNCNKYELGLVKESEVSSLHF